MAALRQLLERVKVEYHNTYITACLIVPQKNFNMLHRCGAWRRVLQHMQQVYVYLFTVLLGMDMPSPSFLFSIPSLPPAPHRSKAQALI